VAAAVDIVDAYIQALPGERRRIAHAEWGLTLDADHAAGWPLDVGLRIADGLVTVKAYALTAPHSIEPWMLLWWNRSTRLVRFGCTQAREIWVHGDLPVAAVSEQEVDRLLGLVVEGAVAVRDFQRAKLEPPPSDAGWLDPSGR
jgi:Putative bacterial sensory transduction regulator